MRKRIVKGDAMREILFEGKRADNGEWVKGFYYEDLGSFIKEKATSVSTNIYLVFRESVGQFIGLVDKSGKRIFEGNIVRAKRLCNQDIYTGVIVFLNGCFAIKGTNTRCVSSVDLFEDFEIIGRIYDNPELLRGSI